MLFELRFESGDNYPAYSTLRADPLGARALYDSLAALPDVTASRNLRPLCELNEGAGATLCYLGVDPGELGYFVGDEARHLESFLVSGGRLVLSLEPLTRKPSSFVLLPRGSGTATTATTGAAATSATLTAAAGGGSLRKAQTTAEENEKKLAAKRQAAQPAPT